MSSNVGLSTPRGSGTSGYVQRNLSHLRSRNDPYPPKDFRDEALKHRHRKPDQEILEHDRKREVEVKVFELRDRLEDEGVDEEEITLQTAALREKLLSASSSKSNAKNLKPHQVHELAKAKMEENEKLRKALEISEDYEEGSHWRKQEERAREAGLGDKSVKERDE
ncbi:MAG: RNA-splicing factor [Trichoglossum hirsutum]|nr:MAG: RNA-splicing factor [Trichoglossum hirsutum]